MRGATRSQLRAFRAHFFRSTWPFWRLGPFPGRPRGRISEPKRRFLRGFSLRSARDAKNVRPQQNTIANGSKRTLRLSRDAPETCKIRFECVSHSVRLQGRFQTAFRRAAEPSRGRFRSSPGGPGPSRSAPRAPESAPRALLVRSRRVPRASRSVAGASPNRSETLRRPPDRFFIVFASIFN